MTSSAKPFHHPLVLTLGLGVALGFSQAKAEDYPFSGLFWPSFGSVDATYTDRLCALTFLDQRTDGSWAVHHVDLEAFRKDGTITYHRLSEGTCTYAPETKVETCLVTLDKSYPDGAGDTVYDVVTAIHDDRVDTVMIETPADWESVIASGSEIAQEQQLNYLRCPYPEATIKALISPDVTTLSADELNALRSPTDELLADPDVAALVKALRAN